jgi:hypothetical protein
VEHVLEDEEERQLRELRLPAGEWYLPCLKADSLGDRVEHPDLRIRISMENNVRNGAGDILPEPQW